MPKNLSALSDHMRAPGVNVLSSLREDESLAPTSTEGSSVDEAETPPAVDEAPRRYNALHFRHHSRSRHIFLQACMYVPDFEWHAWTRAKIDQPHKFGFGAIDVIHASALAQGAIMQSGA